MAQVPCAQCGRCEDVRSMQACAHCGDWLCPSCAAVNSFCPRCMEDEALNQHIL